MAGFDLPLRAIRAADLGGARPDRAHRRASRTARAASSHITEVLRMESDVITAPGHLRVRDRVGRARPDDHRRASAPTGLRPVFLDEVPQARHRAPAEHVRRARRLARRAHEGADGVRLRGSLCSVIARAAVAALASRRTRAAAADVRRPTLTEAPTPGFPDKAYVCRLPDDAAAHGGRGRRSTENGEPCRPTVTLDGRRRRRAARSCSSTRRTA